MDRFVESKRMVVNRESSLALTLLLLEKIVKKNGYFIKVILLTLLLSYLIHVPNKRRFITINLKILEERDYGKVDSFIIHLRGFRFIRVIRSFEENDLLR